MFSSDSKLLTIHSGKSKLVVFFLQVNGNWAKWGLYNECTKECGGGSMTRTRTCTDPAPQFGGKGCVGESTQTSACNTQSCPGEQIHLP